MRLDNMEIDKIIVHQIFDQEDNKVRKKPHHNNRLSTLDAHGNEVLRKRIVGAMGDNAHCIDLEFSRTDELSTSILLSKMLSSSDDEFIRLSCIITDYLSDSQRTRNIPGGIVFIFSGTIREGNKFISVLKAEQQEGFTVEQSKDSELLVNFISNLFLTPHQKLYKIAMLVESNLNKITSEVFLASNYSMHLYDQNTKINETSEAAQYFYKDFLGCQMMNTNKRVTAEFYNNTLSYINNLTCDDNEKVHYADALYIYIKVAQCRTISVSDFGKQYFDDDIGDGYIRYMKKKQFTLDTFEKDVTAIQNKLKRKKMRFSSNVTITTPDNEIIDLVKILNEDLQSTTLRVKGKIVKLY